MQHTFEINAGQHLLQRLIAALAKFGHRKVKVVIECRKLAQEQPSK